MKSNSKKIIAIGGAASLLAVPLATEAAEFKDLKNNNSHYENIIELKERGIISGYKDGTFKPNAQVTRGQAAKMLALMLDLDVSNVKGQTFKDVSTKHGSYEYIEVLVQKGIISGFVDGSFKPNEPITRAQMAKILVKGFQFVEAKKLNHNFSDVTEKNSSRFYIQTLVDLGITKGTTAVTYSPASPVTRGQMSTFLIRAEKVDMNEAKVKEISKIETVNNKTYFYVNGVKHTVDSKLKNIFKEENTEALLGAHIEAVIEDNVIKDVTKLTINALGHESSMFTLDGNNSTFKGVVVVTGNHIKLQDLKIQGKLIIKEQPMKSIANFNKTLAFNIDWGTIIPPEQEEEYTSAPAEKEDNFLVEIPTDNKPKLPVMKNVAHNIQLKNVTASQIVIEGNKTRVSSDAKLKNVLVQGNVREFELFANVEELYLESDENVTFYGNSDIDELYKNSYKSVNLYADSLTKLMLVDNKHGWIDLGDFFRIDKAIIPYNTQPYEIFNDFLNDSDKIGDLKDPSGKEIDRDPIGNTIIPDQEEPNLLIKNVDVNLATAKVTMNSDEDGLIYYLVKRKIDGEPSTKEIMQYTGSMGGFKAVSAGQDTLITVENLKDEQSYIVYAVAVDEAGNVSVKEQLEFNVMDATAPSISPVNIQGLPGGKRLEVSMTPSEPGEYFYYYEPIPFMGVPKELSSVELLNYVEMNYQKQTGKGTVSEKGKMTFDISGLEAETQYAVHLVMKDKHGNLMVKPTVLLGTTTELDDVYPYITDGQLRPVNNDYYEFELTVNEVLDPESANDVNNYLLSGTAILNIDGQPTTIKPDSVTYEEGSKKIKVRVPSATALVNGDTIVLEILPGVKDLAENEFVNENVVETAEEIKNKATYVFSDTLQPMLTIEDFQINPLKTNGILTYKANKAGTYYYMIVPNSYDMNGMLPRDFYNEFTSEPTLPADKRIPSLVKQGDNGNNTVVVGSQSQNVILPTPEDPFESYSLFMVMKDRSGQLSDIQKVENVINDSRAPFVSSLEVYPREGSDSIVDITINSSEKGTVFYKRLEKEIYDSETEKMIPNPEIAEIEGWNTLLSSKKENHALINDELAKQYVSKMRSWTHTELQEEGFTKFADNDLNAHTEYVYFFAVEDTFGNITMYSENTETADRTDYSFQMKKEVYTDGINPTVNPFIKLVRKPEFERFNLAETYPSAEFGNGVLSHIPGNTFIMTFSEAVKYTGPSNGKNDLENLAVVIEAAMGVKIKDMEWEETVATNLERKLVFTVESIPAVDVAVNNITFENFKDLNKPEGRQFDEKTLAKYLSPGADLNTIAYAQLTGEVKGPFENHLGEQRHESDTVILGMELNVRNDVTQTYYYVTQTKESGELASFEDVVNLVENPFYGGYRGLGIVGSGDLQQDLTGATNNFSRSLEIHSGSGVFMSSQKLYLVTMDDYGNIVGVYGGSKFVPIIK